MVTDLLQRKHCRQILYKIGYKINFKVLFLSCTYDSAYSLELLIVIDLGISDQFISIELFTYLLQL